jgi:methionyl-tRNA synthetase
VPEGKRNEIDEADAKDLENYHASMGPRGFLLHEALKSVWLTVARGNEYVDRQAPWKLAKDPAQRAELESTLATLMRQLARQAVYLFPFMPRKAEELWRSLGGPGRIDETKFKGADTVDPTGWRVNKGAPLFPKREVATP